MRTHAKLLLLDKILPNGFAKQTSEIIYCNCTSVDCHDYPFQMGLLFFDFVVFVQVFQ